MEPAPERAVATRVRYGRGKGGLPQRFGLSEVRNYFELNTCLFLCQEGL